MKKQFLSMMVVSLLMAGLTACSGSSSKPFKEYVDYTYESMKELLDNPEILNDESKLKAMEEKSTTLLNEIKQKTVAVAAEDGIGYELLSDVGRIDFVDLEGGLFRFSIKADVKQTGDGMGTYMGVLTDEKGQELYAQTINPRRGENGNIVFDYSVSIPKKGVFFFGEAEKLVIMKMDAQRRDEIMRVNNLRVGKIYAKLKGEAVDEEDEESAGNSGAGKAAFVFDGKLGPVKVGEPISNLPQSVDGLYDKYDYKKEEHEDEMDGPWTEEYYLFTKDSKEIFRADIYEGKVNQIRLLSGSTFIATPDGISVGSSARELFKKKPMEWTNYYDGNCFGTSGNYCYYINAEDLIQTDVPNKAEQIKPNAKVIGISYNQ